MKFYKLIETRPYQYGVMEYIIDFHGTTVSLWQDRNQDIEQGIMAMHEPHTDRLFAHITLMPCYDNDRALVGFVATEEDNNVAIIRMMRMGVV